MKKERDGEISFKELAHKIVVEAWQAQNLQGKVVDWRPKEELQLSSKIV